MYLPEESIRKRYPASAMRLSRRWLGPTRPTTTTTSGRIEGGTPPANAWWYEESAPRPRSPERAVPRIGQPAAPAAVSKASLS